MNDTLAHRHGPYVHSHPCAKPHRHLWLPALARPTVDEAAPTYQDNPAYHPAVLAHRTRRDVRDSTPIVILTLPLIASTT